MELRRWQRVLLALAAPAAAGLLYAYERSGAELACPFYRLTGLYCPGCGSGRAVRALLHGHLLQALSYNYLLDLLLVPALCVCAWEYLRLLFPGAGLRPVFVPQRVTFGCLVLVCSFWILRNIPAFAFLAPGG